MKLYLNKFESKEFVTKGYVIVARKGQKIMILKNNNYECGYSIDIIDPYDVVVLDKEAVE